MYSENGVMINFEELRKVIDSADVFAVGFQNFPQRLLVDTRSTGQDEPLLAVVDPVGTVQERFWWLGQHRPRLGMPHNFKFFVWPHSIRYLEESGILADIRRHLETSGYDMTEQYERVLEALRALERWSLDEAVRGQTYKTLWSAR